MNHKIVAGLALAGCLAIAPSANALPLVDFGFGVGQTNIEDDKSGAIAAHGMVDVNIPATPFSVEGMLTQTIVDGTGSFDYPFSGWEYRGNQLGAFFAFTTPTPMIKVKAKAGVVRSDYDFDPDAVASDRSGTELGYGIGVSLSDWHFDWTRTTIEDGGDESNVDYLSLTFMF